MTAQLPEPYLPDAAQPALDLIPLLTLEEQEVDRQ